MLHGSVSVSNPEMVPSAPSGCWWCALRRRSVHAHGPCSAAVQPSRRGRDCQGRNRRCGFRWFSIQLQNQVATVPCQRTGSGVGPGRASVRFSAWNRQAARSGAHPPGRRPRHRARGGRCNAYRRTPARGTSSRRIRCGVRTTSPCWRQCTVGAERVEAAQPQVAARHQHALALIQQLVGIAGGHMLQHDRVDTRWPAAAAVRSGYHRHSPAPAGTGAGHARRAAHQPARAWRDPQPGLCRQH